MAPDRTESAGKGSAAGGKGTGRPDEVRDLVATAPGQAAPAGLWQIPVFLLGVVALGATLGWIVTVPPKGTVPMSSWIASVRARLEANDPFGALERLEAVGTTWESIEDPDLRLSIALLHADVNEAVSRAGPAHAAQRERAIWALRAAVPMTALRGAPRGRRSLRLRLARLRIEAGDTGGPVPEDVRLLDDPVLTVRLALARGEVAEALAGCARLGSGTYPEVEVHAAARMREAALLDAAGMGEGDGARAAAEALWDRFLEGAPEGTFDRLGALAGRAQVREARGRVAEALQDAVAVLAGEATDAPWYEVERRRGGAAIHAGRMLMEAGQDSRAQAVLTPRAGDRADARYYSDIQGAARLLLGRACWRTGSRDLALDRWEAMVRTFDPDAWRCAGWLPLAEISRTLLDAYGDLDPKDPHAEALKRMLVAVTEGEERSAHARDWVGILAARGAWCDAGALCERLLEDGTIDSRRVEAFRETARLYAAGGAFLRAARAWETSLALGGAQDRAYWDAVHACGVCYREAGLLDRAREMFDRNVSAGLDPALERGVGDELTVQQVVQQSRLEAARVRVTIGEEAGVEEAVGIYRSLLRSPTLGPQASEWRDALGELGILQVRRSERLGMTEPLWEGLAHLDEYLQRYGDRIDPVRRTEVQFARAHGLMMARRWDEAAQAWAALRASRPTVPPEVPALVLEACALLESGRPAPAIPLLEAAAARDADADGAIRAALYEARRLAGIDPGEAPEGAGAGWEAARRSLHASLAAAGGDAP